MIIGEDYVVISGSRNVAYLPDTPENAELRRWLQAELARWDPFAGFWRFADLQNHWRVKRPSRIERALYWMLGYRWYDRRRTPP